MNLNNNILANRKEKSNMSQSIAVQKSRDEIFCSDVKSDKSPLVTTCSRILSLDFCTAIDWLIFDFSFRLARMLLFKFISTFQRTFYGSSINRRSLFCFSRHDAGSLRFTISPRGSQDQRGGNCLCRFTCAPFASLPDGRTTGERELYL